MHTSPSTSVMALLGLLTLATYPTTCDAFESSMTGSSSVRPSAWKYRYKGPERRIGNYKTWRNWDYRAGWPRCNYEICTNSRQCGFKPPNMSPFVTFGLRELCYYYSDIQLNFTDFIRFCETFGPEARPYSPRDEFEVNYVSNNRPKHVPYWIGYTDSKEQGTFQWTVPGMPSKVHTLWAPGEPNNASSDDLGTQDCVSISGLGNWDDEFCASNYRFICELPKKNLEREPIAIGNFPATVKVGETVALWCQAIEAGTDGLLGVEIFSDFAYVRHESGESRQMPRPEGARPVPARSWEHPHNELMSKVSYHHVGIPKCVQRRNLTVSFNVTWALHLAQMACCNKGGCTDPVRVVIEAYPQAPNLTVLWSGQPGRVYTGSVLVAQCQAYVSGFRGGYILWQLDIPGREPLMWKASPSEIMPDSDSGNIWSLPEFTDCPRRGDFRDFQTGSCFKQVARLATWKVADSLCRRIGHGWALAKIYDSDLFSYIRSRLNTNEEYWVDLNDRAEQGTSQRLNGSTDQYVKWKDYRSESKEAKSDADQCVLMAESELVVQSPCSLRRPFICQSADRLAVSRSDYDEEQGPVQTSVLQLSVNRSMNGAKLNCFSWDLASKSSNRQVHSRVSKHPEEISAGPTKIEVHYGVQMPVMTVHRKYAGGHSVLTFTCHTHLGNMTKMMWNLEEEAGSEFNWTANIDGAVLSVQSHPAVKISVKDTRPSTDYGNKLITVLTLDLSGPVKLVTVRCYPFDGTSVAGPQLLQPSETPLERLVASYAVTSAIWAKGRRKILKQPPAKFLKESLVILILLLAVSLVGFIVLMRDIEEGAATQREISPVRKAPALRKAASGRRF